MPLSRSLSANIRPGDRRNAGDGQSNPDSRIEEVTSEGTKEWQLDRDGCAFCQSQNYAAPRFEPAKGHNESRNVRIRYERTLHRADQYSNQNRCSEGGKQSPTLSECRDAACESYDCANRKVDVAADNDHQHADGQHAGDGHLLQEF